MTQQELQARMQEAMGHSKREIACFFAPGRVNIIGEHQDYNGGHVFPAALTVGIYGGMRVREDRKVRLFSANMEHEVILDMDAPFTYDPAQDWANYPLGILQYIKDQGHTLPGLDLYFEGNLPAGAGLSSSACILDLTGFMIWSLLGCEIDRTKLAEMAQQVEFHFVGVKVGIMDQFAISQGKANCGVLLDCTSMQYRLVPLRWDGYELIIMNTNKQRGLIDSKFNERKGECDAALAILQKYRDISGLSLAAYEDLAFIKDDVLKRRARHALTENGRVLKFIEALEGGRIEDVASLINASHDSLKYDYEVSGYELDTIVDIARKQPGCIAARMTGAGFGGCAIALVETTQVAAFLTNVPPAYAAETGTLPSLYTTEIGEGVHRI